MDSNLKSAMVRYVHREKYGLFGTGCPRSVTSIFAQLLSFGTDSTVQWSTETKRTIRNREPRTFTQLLCSVILQVQSVVNYVHRDHTDC